MCRNIKTLHNFEPPATRDEIRASSLQFVRTRFFGDECAAARSRSSKDKSASALGETFWREQWRRCSRAHRSLNGRRMNQLIRGSCLCGGVRFEVEPPFLQASHCHCDRCRKHSGTAVCTQARVRQEQFRLLQGEELIRVYGKGEGAVKAFCINCGSSLFGGDWPDGPQVSIRMGAFDDDPGIRPQFHTFVGDRAPWDAITDNLPQYSERRT